MKLRNKILKLGGCGLGVTTIGVVPPIAVYESMKKEVEDAVIILKSLRTNLINHITDFKNKTLFYDTIADLNQVIDILSKQNLTQQKKQQLFIFGLQLYLYLERKGGG